MVVSGVAGALRGNSLVTGATGAVAFSQILKEFYRPAVVDQLNSKTVLARMLGRKSEGVEGKYMVIDLNVGRNFGFGYAAENGRLPDPQAQQFQQARYDMRYSYGRIKFSGPSASASRGDRGSFIRMMDAEVQGLARDIQHNDNRIMFGNGSGRLCQLVSGAGAGPWTVSNPGGIVSTALGTQYLDVNMRVATVAADTAAVPLMTQPGALFTGGMRSAFIASVDRTSGTVTFKNSAGAATSLSALSGAQYLYIANDESTDLPGTSWGRGLESQGLAALIDDADPIFQDGTSYAAGLGSIPVANFPIWKAPVIDNTGTAIPFNPDMLQQAMDLVDQVSDGSVDLWVTTHGIRRQYLNSLVGAKRFPNTMELDGGFKALTYDGRPMVVDKDCTRGRIYGLSLESIFLIYETDYDWLDQDGSVLHRIPDQDAFQATMYRYWNMATDARNRSVLIEDIIDS